MATTEQCNEAKARLTNKVLRRAQNEFDSDYSGGSGFYEKNFAIFLYGDGTFLFQEKTFVSISAAGFSLPRESLKEVVGRWLIGSRAFYPQLLLLDRNGDVFMRVETRNGGTGIEVMNGKNWNRYLIQ